MTVHPTVHTEQYRTVPVMISWQAAKPSCQLCSAPGEGGEAAAGLIHVTRGQLWGGREREERRLVLENLEEVEEALVALHSASGWLLVDPLP